MIDSLPADWKWVVSSEIIDVRDGTHDTPKYVEAGIPLITSKNLKNNRIDFEKVSYISENDHDEISKRSGVEEGDVLFAMIGTIGNPAVIKGNTKFSIKNVGLFKKNEDQILPSYLVNFLRSSTFEKQLTERKLLKGTTQKFIPLGNLRQIHIPLAPKTVQQAIVSIIEELFSELDKGIENLRLAQQQLKIYRQSVLKWAFEGKLSYASEDVSQNGLEPHSMAAEEQAESGGKLPKGWKLTPLGNHIEKIVAGKSYRCQERPPLYDEVGIIKVSAVTWGTFNEQESKTCFSNESYNSNYIINKEDFLFSRANTLDLIGACVIVKSISKHLMLSDKILRFSFTNNVLPAYILHYLRSKSGRKQIETLSTGNQESMRNIGQEKIKQIQIPFCSLSQQKKIVEQIENRFSVADKMEESINQSLQQVEALRQSILKKAFEGKLTDVL